MALPTLTLPNTGEPFGLPRGTVRGIIALSLTATLIQQVVTGAIDSVAFIGVAGPFLGFYVSERGKSDEAAAVVAAAVAADAVAAPAYSDADPND